MSPKVSIIVPVYNAEQTLRRCVDSVLSQTYTDFELLLVDDGSRDSSAAICDGYAALTISPKKPSVFTLALRIPSFASDSFSVSVNGEPVACTCEDSCSGKGYLRVSRKWKAGDVVEVSMRIDTRLETLNGMQAVVRGPIVFARDSRFSDGYGDESAGWASRSRWSWEPIWKTRLTAPSA